MVSSFADINKYRVLNSNDICFEESILVVNLSKDVEYLYVVEKPFYAKLYYITWNPNLSTVDLFYVTSKSQVTSHTAKSECMDPYTINMISLMN